MNNEQNNGVFGIPNQNNNLGQSMGGDSVIPGANLIPVGQNDNLNVVNPAVSEATLNTNNVGGGMTTFQQANVESNILTPNPIPGIVSGTPVNPPNIPNTPINTLSNNSVNMVSNGMGDIHASNSVIPNIVSEPVVSNLDNISANNDGLNNSMMGNGIGVQSSLNGIGSEPLVQPTLTPNLPVGGQTGVLNTNQSQPMNMSLGDATPLTNEGGSFNDGAEVVSVFKWLGLMLLFMIPIVGPIMLLVKAFGKEKNRTIKNYARAQLLFAIIIGILTAVITIAMFALAFGSATSSTGSNYNSYDSYYGY